MNGNGGIIMNGGIAPGRPAPGAAEVGVDEAPVPRSATARYTFNVKEKQREHHDDIWKWKSLI